MASTPIEALAQTAALLFEVVFMWKAINHIKHEEMALARICLFISLLGFVLVKAV